MYINGSLHAVLSVSIIELTLAKMENSKEHLENLVGRKRAEHLADYFGICVV